LFCPFLFCPERRPGLIAVFGIATWLLSVGGEEEAQADKPLDIKEPSGLGALSRCGKR